MISSVHNNASAIRAFSTQLNASAGNVANALSSEYKSIQARNVETRQGGVGTVLSRDPGAGPLVEDPVTNDGSLRELSNTDIGREMVGQMSAGYGISANAAVIHTRDETTGTVINLIA